MIENEETITVSKQDLINFIKYHHHPKSEPTFDLKEVEKFKARRSARYNSHLLLLNVSGLKY
jgi:hypothetical protein